MKLARRVLDLHESATLAVSANAARMKAEGIDVIGFGVGEPDFDTPDHIKEACYAAIRAGHTRYSKPASGIPIAKRAVCEKFHRENDLDYAMENVMVTAGGKMACYLAFQAIVEPGDEVIIPQPYWVSYPDMVRLAGGVPVFVTGSPERDHKLTPEDLKPFLNGRTKLFVFNSPSNPGGFTYDPDEVRALADLLAEYPISILSDEMYDRLMYNGQQTLSFAACSQRAFERTVTINAASKTYAMTGWRVGYAAGPKDLIAAMAKLQSQSTSGAATFNQHALAAALTGDQTCVQTMRKEFEKRATYMFDRLSSISGVRCPRPTGAFYCFPDVSETYARLGVANSTEFAHKILEETRVAVVPGGAFGADKHVRLSFALSMDQITEGLNRLERFLSA